MISKFSFFTKNNNIKTSPIRVRFTKIYIWKTTVCCQSHHAYIQTSQPIVSRISCE